MRLQLKKSKTYKDHTGSLIPFYKNDSFKKFDVKRFFFVYGNKKYFRADHAHKKCNQILIPISGTVKIEVFNLKKNKKTFTLSDKNKKYLFVPTFYYIKIKFLQKKGVLLTLCDYKYDKRDYIEKEEFFNL